MKRFNCLPLSRANSCCHRPYAFFCSINAIRWSADLHNQSCARDELQQPHSFQQLTIAGNRTAFRNENCYR